MLKQSYNTAEQTELQLKYLKYEDIKERKILEENVQEGNKIQIKAIIRAEEEQQCDQRRD